MITRSGRSRRALETRLCAVYGEIDGDYGKPILNAPPVVGRRYGVLCSRDQDRLLVPHRRRRNF